MYQNKIFKKYIYIYITLNENLFQLANYGEVNIKHKFDVTD